MVMSKSSSCFPSFPNKKLQYVRVSPFWGYPAKAHKPPRDTETIGGGCRLSGRIAERWRDRDMIGIAMGHPQKESKRLQFSWRSLFFFIGQNVSCRGARLIMIFMFDQFTGKSQPKATNYDAYNLW